MSIAPIPPRRPARHLRLPGSRRARWLALLAVLALAVAWPDAAEPTATAASAGSPARSAATSTAPAAKPSEPARTPSASPSVAPTRAGTPPTGPAAPSAQPAATPAPRPVYGTALTTLAVLQVKGRAPKSGYERDLFGQTWADVDRNGCDTRNDILRRDLTAYTLKAGTRGCLVLRGTLRDPYTASTIAFVRGQATSSKVQIDHVVALSDAWQKGAQQLTAGQRTALANDPLNLLAVDGPTNLRKGDGDAATWLPPAKAYRCQYVARQVAVKKRYGLWVTAAERDAIARVLQACPSQALPSAGVIALGGGRTGATAPAPPASPAAPKPSAAAATDPRFSTCKAAIAAGYGPYRDGRDPEYAWYQDRDSDGIVCE